MFFRLLFSCFIIFSINVCFAEDVGIDVNNYIEQRKQLIDEIKDKVASTATHLNSEKLGSAVLKAIETVPRHEFVPPNQRKYAYQNRPLPIGHGQTISQPYIVAIMTDLLGLKVEDKVLEIGTGSGYQAAILATLVDKVYSIEIIEPLGKAASERLDKFGFKNVEVRLGDGYYGWNEHAPFDAIIVTASPETIPRELIQQLAFGGRMIVPVGEQMQQRLLVITRDEEGVVEEELEWVSFVPMVKGRH